MLAKPLAGSLPACVVLPGCEILPVPSQGAQNTELRPNSYTEIWPKFDIFRVPSSIKHGYHTMRNV